MMKELLENDFPQYYGVGKRPTAVEKNTSELEFDLVDAPMDFLRPVSTGFVSFINDGKNLSVINYEGFLNKFGDTKISKGKHRCDFIMTDTISSSLCLLCEITSTKGGVSNLSKPIVKETGKEKVKILVFPGGKYEKAEQQLLGTLRNIMPVPTIKSFVDAKSRKVCLMGYKIFPGNSTQNAFNRGKQMEAEEAGENGAMIPSPEIEAFGFQYFRISNKYKFKL